MKVSRRSFLSLIALQYMALQESHAESTKGQCKLSILQGLTDESSSEFTVMKKRGQDLSVIAVNKHSGRRHEPAWQTTESREFSDWEVMKFAFSGLDLASRYELFVLESGGGVVRDQREFGLLDFSRTDIRVGVLSCMNDHLYRKSMWKSLKESDTDILFFIGDNVYCDKVNAWDSKSADPAQIWQRYVEVRRKIGFYHWDKLIPVVATWDDHDFGDDNAVGDFKYKDDATKTLQSFFAQQGQLSCVERGPGVSLSLEAFGQRFVFMDNRTFRTRDGGATGTQFGPAQESWLYSILNESAKPTWLIMGSQWFGGKLSKHAFNQNHPEAMEKFLDNIRNSASPVAFMSGDVHYSEVIEVEEEVAGYLTLEVTSSSMHSSTFPGWHLIMSNPRRLKATSRHNFNLLDLNAAGTFLAGRVKCVGPKQKVIYTVHFNLDRKLGVQFL